MSLLLPETDTTVIENIFADSDFYGCEDFNLSDVLSQEFIDGFLKNGIFSCIPVEQDRSSDSFSFHNNKLSLRVHKDSMYSINGIVLASLKPRREGEFFGKFSDCRSCSTLINFQLDFTIELTTFSGDLDKLSEELASIFNPTHVNLTWIPNSNDICVSSIAKYFSDAGRNVKLCKNKISSRPEFGLKFPDLSQEDDEARLLEISEYIGLVLLECSIEDNQFSSYRLPENCIEVGRGKVFLGKGFFVPNTVKQLIDESRKILSNNPDFPWIAIVTVFKTTPELTARSKTIVVAKDKIYFQS